MRFDFTQLARAPLALVESAYVDVDFYGSIDGSSSLAVLGVLDHTEAGGTATLRIRMAFTGDVSSAVRAFVDPEKLTWVTVIAQRAGSHCSTFEIQPDHYAGLLHCRGGYRYLEQPGDETTRIEVAGDLSVKVPLMGRVAERAIADGFRDHLADEAQALAAWGR